MVFAALVLFVLLCFVAVTYNVGSLVHKRISLQNAADASSLSGATWEAKGLNLIASLNQGIVTMFGIMTGYVVVTGVSAFVMPALSSQMIQCAPDVLITLYTIAGEMAKLEKKIVEVTPYLVDAEALRIANANSPRAVVLPYPFIPGDPHKKASNLGLHVRKGKLKEIVRKIVDKALEILPRPVRNALDREPLKSFVKEPFYKAIENTAGSFDFDEKGAMSFEETKVVIFERGKEEAGYTEYSEFMSKAKKGKVKVSKGSESLVYAREVFTLDPQSCKEKSVRSDEVKMGRSSLQGLWNPPNPVSADLNSGNTPKEQDYVLKDRWNQEGPCLGKVFKKEEWGFLRFRAEVKEKKKVSQDVVDSPPFPMFLEDDFTERQWLAIVAWDTRESATSPIFPALFKGSNFWGSASVSQARPRSGSTKDGELLWDTDWEARLMPFTAHEALSEHLGRASSRFKAITEKLILH